MENINIMLIVVAAVMVGKMVDGYKKGMVKEVISLISMVVLCVVAPLIAYGVSSYHNGKTLHVVVVVILLSLLVTAHHLVGVVLFPAKLAAKLPIVHSADKLLGILFGMIEVVLVLWTVYAFLMMMDMQEGAIGQRVLAYTKESRILSWFHDNNYLARGIAPLLDGVEFREAQKWVEQLESLQQR